MKTLYFLCILLILSVYTFAQDKISKEEKAARHLWVQNQLKNIPPGAHQIDVEKFYNSLTKSTLDSLLQFELNPDASPNIIENKPKQVPYQMIPIPPNQGKEKVIPIPLQDPEARFSEIKK